MNNNCSTVYTPESNNSFNGDSKVSNAPDDHISPPPPSLLLFTISSSSIETGIIPLMIVSMMELTLEHIRIY